MSFLFPRKNSEQDELELVEYTHFTASYRYDGFDRQHMCRPEDHDNPADALGCAVAKLIRDGWRDFRFDEQTLREVNEAQRNLEPTWFFQITAIKSTAEPDPLDGLFGEVKPPELVHEIVVNIFGNNY